MITLQFTVTLSACLTLSHLSPTTPTPLTNLLNAIIPNDNAHISDYRSHKITPLHNTSATIDSLNVNKFFDEIQTKFNNNILSDGNGSLQLNRITFNNTFLERLVEPLRAVSEKEEVGNRPSGSDRFQIFIQEIFGSLTGLAYGAVGQLLSAFHMGTNLTVRETIERPLSGYLANVQGDKGF